MLKTKEKIKNIKIFNAIFATLLLCTFVCISLLCLSSWAWFKKDILNTNNTISSASFGVDITVKNVANDEIISETESNSYTFSSGTYKITLNKNGNANFGYCIINNEVDTFFTQTISQQQPIIEFTLVVNSQTKITISSFIGKNQGITNINNNEIITI